MNSSTTASTSKTLKSSQSSSHGTSRGSARESMSAGGSTPPNPTTRSSVSRPVAPSARTSLGQTPGRFSSTSKSPSTLTNAPKTTTRSSISLASSSRPSTATARPSLSATTEPRPSSGPTGNRSSVPAASSRTSTTGTTAPSSRPSTSSVSRPSTSTSTSRPGAPIGITSSRPTKTSATPSFASSIPSRGPRAVAPTSATASGSPAKTTKARSQGSDVRKSSPTNGPPPGASPATSSPSPSVSSSSLNRSPTLSKTSRLSSLGSAASLRLSSSISAQPSVPLLQRQRTSEMVLSPIDTRPLSSASSFAEIKSPRSTSDIPSSPRNGANGSIDTSEMSGVKKSIAMLEKKAAEENPSAKRSFSTKKSFETRGTVEENPLAKGSFSTKNSFANSAEENPLAKGSFSTKNSFANSAEENPLAKGSFSTKNSFANGETAVSKTSSGASTLNRTSSGSSSVTGVNEETPKVSMTRSGSAAASGVLRKSSTGRFARIDTPEIEAATTSRPLPKAPSVISRGSSILLQRSSSSSLGASQNSETAPTRQISITKAASTNSASIAPRHSDSSSSSTTPGDPFTPPIDVLLQNSTSTTLLHDVLKAERLLSPRFASEVEVRASSPATPDEKPSLISETSPHVPNTPSDMTSGGTTPDPTRSPPELVDAAPTDVRYDSSVADAVSGISPQTDSQPSAARTRVDDSLKRQSSRPRFAASRSSKLIRGPTMRFPRRTDSEFTTGLSTNRQKKDDDSSETPPAHLTGGVVKRPTSIKEGKRGAAKDTNEGSPAKKPQPRIISASSPVIVVPTTWLDENTQTQATEGPEGGETITANQIAEMVSGTSTTATPVTVTIASGAVVCTTAVLVGSYPISIGKNTIIQPGAFINAENGPIEIGEGNIIEELVVIQNRDTSPLKIGNYNLLETGCHVLDGSIIGNGNQLAPKSIIGPKTSVMNTCIVSSGSSITTQSRKKRKTNEEDETKEVPSGSVVYGASGEIASGLDEGDEATRLMKQRAFMSMFAAKLIPILSSTQSRRQGHGAPDLPPIS